MMFVDQILSSARERLVTIKDTAPLVDAAKLLSCSNINLLVVCNETNVLVGVITKTDIVRQIGRCTGSDCAVPLASAMTKNVITCRPNGLLRDVWAIMKERGHFHLPVISEDFKPLGVINARDTLLTLLKEVENEETLLRDYVMGIGYR